MWVASLGDSEGSEPYILFHLFLNGARGNPVSVVDLGRIVDKWTATPLNDLHNLKNAAEV